MELARPSYGVRSDYPLFTITDGTSWEHLKQGAMEKNIEATAEVLSHFQQLDSIDEAGIDANLMVPPSDEEEFIFVWKLFTNEKKKTHFLFYNQYSFY